MAISYVIGTLSTVNKGLVKRLMELEMRSTCGDHPNYSIIKFGQITEKRPGDLKRLNVTQTPREDHLLMLV